MRNSVRSMIVTVLMFVAGNSFAADAHLMVMDPWVREAPPNAKMLAGYFTIMNHSGKSAEIVGASSDKFEKVELHKSVQEGGVAKMVAQPSVEVGKHATVKFQPGGLHLMLINPKAPLKAGDKVDITLKLKKGEDLKMTAVVKKGGSMEGHDHEHMEHMHHDH
ncbi:MAG: copper chaperone PCu(A)C [Gammaproteobacteria bacterium]